MEKLSDELQRKIAQMKCEANIDFSTESLDDLYSVYPFNKFEFIISHLIASGAISLSKYLDMRNAYLERNKYLYVFGITAPRTFGEVWTQKHLNEIVPELQRPTRKIDSNYSGQYELDDSSSKWWHKNRSQSLKGGKKAKRGITHHQGIIK